MITSVNNRNDFKPTPAAGDDRERIIRRLTEYSSPFGDLGERVKFAD